MKYNLQDFILELNTIIPEIERELTNRKMGIAGDGTVEQLTLFIDELKKIQSMAVSNNLPSKEHRYTAFTWYITDSWYQNSQLGKKLCELADKYKRKLE
ncbi:hypothetical protein [Capillibacterium thermochitinicola]|uniref:Uncharacterized protein n=1 Tax=Capillibacterium thermochitinicola TaxID=2699427 RepID=A0A8J6LJC1_9FIRM|nr:hypothetical protein [Capillibacterium thermochitinicola]MBA2133696.1 hypothetical protein [Capillibacterium thermochitinicola]